LKKNKQFFVFGMLSFIRREKQQQQTAASVVKRPRTQAHAAFIIF